MKSAILMLMLAVTGTVAQAQPYHHAPYLFESRAPGADDAARCMAIGCAEGDYERYPEYAPTPIDERYPEYMPMPIDERAPYPASEDEARESFYRTVRMHADGAATIEQVEAAYQHLLPYRR